MTVYEKEETGPSDEIALPTGKRQKTDQTVAQNKSLSSLLADYTLGQDYQQLFDDISD